MTMDAAGLVKIIEAVAEKIGENREFLTELDSAIGDADHGINMSKGFSAVVEKLHSQKIDDCGAILKTVGMTLVSTVGGASGPLYGTAFMKAGQAMVGKSSLDFEDFVTILDQALEGIKYRGKAQRGEKTIIDSLEPAVEILKNEKTSTDKKSVMERALNASRDGMEYTKNIIAKKGRASYLGERSLGHQDPGATSCYLMLEAAIEKIKDMCKSA
ncbi:MAG: phosphoenolpyruvate---glycerone phosphotransferase subunit DhaL [Tepidanaerobacteraceae bacterium]|nr:phosphoenolpyruvate---glycerone phosphotransferase subunit DhaL [Tepidanaerobacteraceae bacterium]